MPILAFHILIKHHYCLNLTLLLTLTVNRIGFIVNILSFAFQSFTFKKNQLQCTFAWCMDKLCKFIRISNRLLKLSHVLNQFKYIFFCSSFIENSSGVGTNNIDDIKRKNTHTRQLCHTNLYACVTFTSTHTLSISLSFSLDLHQIKLEVCAH